MKRGVPLIEQPAYSPSLPPHAIFDCKGAAWSKHARKPLKLAASRNRSGEFRRPAVTQLFFEDSSRQSSQSDSQRWSEPVGVLVVQSHRAVSAIVRKRLRFPARDFPSFFSCYVPHHGGKQNQRNGMRAGTFGRDRTLASARCGTNGPRALGRAPDRHKSRIGREALRCVGQAQRRPKKKRQRQEQERRLASRRELPR